MYKNVLKNIILNIILLCAFQSFSLFAQESCICDIVLGSTCIIPDIISIEVSASNLDQLLLEISETQEFLCSKIDAISIGDAPCSFTQITSAQTISSPGFYGLCNDIAGAITIDANNVTLDLNNRVVEQGIEITSGRSAITLFNGTVRGTLDGIKVNSGCSDITISHVNAENATRGIFFEGVSNCAVDNCDLTQNTTGLYAQDSHGITVQKTNAKENTHAGFEFVQSYTNCVIESKALSTGAGNTDAFDNNVFGFVSNDGSANIFERCIANGTLALSTTDFNSLVAGFALRGSESCSKIIECEAANSKTSTQGNTIPYGILHEQLFDQSYTQTAVPFVPSPTGSQIAVDWSPDGQYLAVGGSLAGSQVAIYQVDRTAFTVTRIATPDIEPEAQSFAVSFSPSGRYVAAGFAAGDSIRLRVYEFCPLNNMLKQVATPDVIPNDAVLALAWSPDETKLAVGGDFTNFLALYSFNRVSYQLQLQATPSVPLNAERVFGIDWSHNGNYVAVAVVAEINAQNLKVFDMALNVIAQAQPTSTNTEHITIYPKWSPDDTFIAVGSVLSDPSAQEIPFASVAVFDPVQATLETQSFILTGTITSFMSAAVDWSPDGKYIAYALFNEDQDSKVGVFEYDRSTKTVRDVVTPDDSLSSFIATIEWSPDGQLIALSGASTRMYAPFESCTQNVITQNISYCNQQELLFTTTNNQTVAYTNGIGISASSVANMVTKNISYNNGQAYAYAQNVFNQLFGINPSDVQNIAIDACHAQCTPEDLGLLAQQARFQANSVLSIVDALQTFTTQAGSLLDQIGLCNPTPVTNANTTITQEGTYCVAEPITGTIAINASNVDLDLNGYEIGGGVTIGFPTGVNEIKVANGTVLPSGDSIGLLVNDSNNVLLKNIVATGGGDTGIDITNSHDIHVINCQSTNNEVGLRATDSYNVNVSDTIASNNSRIGFELASTYTSCFENCKSLSSGFENTTPFNTQVFGFVSNNGFGNIFERCIANATQALSTTDSNSLVAGFALRGSEHCTKIIDSESANTIASNAGVTVPYGILLEGTLDATQSITGTLLAGAVNAVSWSADGQYVAVGGTGLTGGTGDEFQILSFDRVANSLTAVTGALGTAGSVRAVSWSADGQYIAVGGAGLTGGTGDEFQIYQFDRSNQTVQFVAGALGTTGSVNAVSWSPDGQYVAVGGQSITGNEFQIFSFDRVANSLTVVAGALGGTVFAVSWSPDGQYIAVGGSLIGGTEEEFQILSFDRVSLTVVAGALGGTVEAVSWSPDGQYIAVGGSLTGGTGDDLQIFSFDRTANSLTAVIGALGGVVNAVSWSPDGQYVAVGGLLTGGTGHRFQIFSFDRANNSLTSVTGALSTLPSAIVEAVSWSPDGQYVAVGGDGLIDGTGDEFVILSGIQFPMKNVITNNTVYCNGNDLTITLTTGQTFASSGGVGISGSSIANMIIGNTAYNNPPSSQNLIVGSNYYFVTNVFNPLFGQAPSALQNISLDGCDPIAVPFDLGLLAKQNFHKASVIEGLIPQLASLTQVDALLSCTQTSQSSAGTISESGSYCVTQPIAGTITIAANDVHLDLNNYTITGGVVINSGVDQVTVTNGIIDANGGVGVQANSNSSNITLSHLTIKNGTDGINFDAVHDANVTQCSLVANEQGISITNSYNVGIEQSIAQDNTNRGFSLVTSSTCCLLDCKAINTGIDNTNIFGADSNVYGFVADRSYGNIFERCIANATQNLSATSFDTVVAGFALLGTGTQCNKIIGCEAGNTKVSSSEQSVGYGIYVDHAVSELEALSAQSYGAVVRRTSWSSDGNYFAVGADNAATDPQELAIYTYDYETNTQTRVAQVNLSLEGASGFALDWSPTYDIIAVASGPNEFSSQFFLFDRINNSLKRIANFGGGNTGQAMHWSFDGLYCVRAAATTSTDTSSTGFQIFQFDPIAEQVLLVFTKATNDTRNEWSPDGRYVAVPNTAPGTGLQIYRFDRATNSATQVNSVSPATGATRGDAVTVTWSPDQKYVVLFRTVVSQINFYEFNEQTGELASAGAFSTGSAPQIGFFSSDGSYLAVTYSATGTEDEITVYRVVRNGTFIELEKVRGFATGATVNDVQWSPDGQLLNATYNNAQHVHQGLLFSVQNIITNNTVYCTGENFDGQGFGISGSSICNSIIQNNAYNNPFNYAYVQNEFNPLSTDEPTLLQNLGLVGCAPIEQPDDIVKLIKRVELLSQSLFDNLL